MQWPITENDLRTALGFKAGEGDRDELELFAQAACEHIDRVTGRHVEPRRHELANGDLPVMFRMAARETAKLWWQQAKSGPRPVVDPDGGLMGPPMGATLPRKVQGWLEPYPPRVGFGEDVRE